MRHHDYDEVKAHLDELHRSQTTTLAPATYRQPSVVYVDPAHLRREHARLFDRLPLVVAFSSELAEPTSFVSRHAAGTPVLIARQPDGLLRAFLYSCRHRDTELACEERHGLVFVARRPGTKIDLDDFLGPLDAEFEAMELGDYVVERTEEIDLDANWKLVMDGFMENYHVRFLHQQTLSPYIYSDRIAFHPLGRHNRAIHPRKTFDPASHSDPEAFLSQVLISYNMLPNVNVEWAGDHFEIYQPEPDPVRPDRCRVKLTVLVRPEERHQRDKWTRNVKISTDIIFNEDFAAAESAQRALSGGAAAPELVFGRNEPQLHHFYRQLSDLVGPAT